MNYFIISSYLTTLFALALGFYVIFKNPINRINQTFALLAFSSVIWSVGLSFEITAPTEALGLFWSKMLHIGVVIVYSAFFHFATAILNQNKQKKQLIILFYATSLFFLSLIPTNWLIKGVQPILSFKFYTQPGILYPLFLLFFFWAVIYGTYLLIKYYRSSSGKKKNQILYVLLATILGFIGSSSTYLPVFGIKIYPIANYFECIYTLLLAYAITKHELMDINVIIKKSTSFIIIGTAVTTILFAANIMTQDNITINSAVIIILGLIFTFSGTWLQKKLITSAKHKFIRGYFDQKEMLTVLSAKLSLVEEHTRHDIFKTITEEFDNFINFEQIGTITAIRNENGDLKHYHLEYSNEKTNSGNLNVELNHPIIEFIRKQTQIKQLSDLNDSAIKFLKSLGFHKKTHLIPFHSPEMLEGVLILGERSGKYPITPEDLEFFNLIINYTSAILYRLTPFEKLERNYINTQKKIHHAELIILRSKRNEYIAHMRQQFCHEICTPLNVIKQVTRRLNENDTSEQEFIKKKILEQVDDATVIVRETLKLSGEEMPERIEKKVDINKTIERCLLLLPASGFELIKELDNIPQTLGVYRDLQIVFTNLMNNAIEAMPNGGIIRIKTYTHQTDIYIEFSDTGIGMTEEQLPEIWEPYISGNQTDYGNDTAGRGWGLTFVNRIIEEHQGDIEVKSKPNIGTTFTLRIPIKTA